MIDLQQVLIGSDPEVFISNGIEVVSAIPYIPGTKENPHPISNYGHYIQTDNIMAEFCVPPVGIDYPEVMYSNIQFCLNYIDKQLPNDLKHHIEASAFISGEYLKDPLARKFGCDPSYNAWEGGKQNVKPKSKNGLRTCGGHIHIGYLEPSVELNMQIIKTLDLFLGVPSILIDTDENRRKMYGKAGEFRHKQYGVEYRVLSNFWLKSEEHVEFIFDNIKRALVFINDGNKIDSETAVIIQNTINTSNKDSASYLCEIFDIKQVIKNKQEICVES